MSKYALFFLLALPLAASAKDVEITPEEAKIIYDTVHAHPQVQAQLKVIPSALETGECKFDRVEVRVREAKEYFGNAWVMYKCPARDGDVVSFSANASVYKEGVWKAFVTSLWTSKREAK